MKTLFITGTDTDTGKTIITASLRAYYKVYFSHKKVGLMKLLQTGIDNNSATFANDGQFYRQLFDDVVIPLSFSTPIAPPLAAEKEGKIIDLGIVWQALSNLQQKNDLVLVEALGGLGSPVTHELTVSDIAGSWHLDSILVVPVKLGAMGQIVANVALSRKCKVNLKGIILNCIKPCTEDEINDLTPIYLIESLTQIPVLGVFPYLDKIDNLETLAKAASQLNLNYFSEK